MGTLAQFPWDFVSPWKAEHIAVACDSNASCVYALFHGPSSDARVPVIQHRLIFGDHNYEPNDSCRDGMSFASALGGKELGSEQIRFVEQSRHQALYVQDHHHNDVGNEDDIRATIATKREREREKEREREGRTKRERKSTQQGDMRNNQSMNQTKERTNEQTNSRKVLNFEKLTRWPLGPSQIDVMDSTTLVEGRDESSWVGARGFCILKKKTRASRNLYRSRIADNDDHVSKTMTPIPLALFSTTTCGIPFLHSLQSLITTFLICLFPLSYSLPSRLTTKSQQRPKQK